MFLVKKTKNIHPSLKKVTNRLIKNVLICKVVKLIITRVFVKTNELWDTNLSRLNEPVESWKLCTSFTSKKVMHQVSNLHML